MNSKIEKLLESVVNTMVKLLVVATIVIIGLAVHSASANKLAMYEYTDANGEHVIMLTNLMTQGNERVRMPGGPRRVERAFDRYSFQSSELCNAGDFKSRDSQVIVQTARAKRGERVLDGDTVLTVLGKLPVKTTICAHIDNYYYPMTVTQYESLYVAEPLAILRY